MDELGLSRVQQDAVSRGEGRDNLSQRAYTVLARALTHSRLPPGQKLVLRPLAARLGLSATPVREALLRLISEQALELDQRSTAVVPSLTRFEFDEVTRLRMVLEGRVAELAAAQCTVEDIAELEALNTICMEGLRSGDYPSMLEANAEFHRLVGRLSRLDLFSRMLEGLWMRTGPVYGLLTHVPREFSSPDRHPHYALIAALRARDSEAARAAATLDLTMSGEMLRGLLPA